MIFSSNLSALIKGSVTALCLALCSLDSAQADISLRLSGTVSVEGAGYTDGQEVNITIKLNPAYTESPQDAFGSNYNSWMRAFDGGERLFDLEGTGITGSLAGYLNGSRALEILIDGEVPAIPLVSFLGSLGEESPLRANGDTISQFHFINLSSNDFNFDYPETYIDPTTYWANRLGTYQLLPGNEFQIKTVETGTATFTLDTMEVIPEPNSVLLLVLGAGGAGALTLLRKRLTSRG